MVNSSTTLILVIVFCVSVADAARTLYTIKGQDGISVSSPAAGNGLCKSMVETQGYICQEHRVTTQDGYILSLQRMPKARSGQPASKPPVFLQHGLLMDGATWMLSSPKEALAFILADSGYDVWIANSRGTVSSLKHKSLDPNNAAYWDWTWDELVTYDLTASVQYVHDKTGQKLHYVGHSLGTLMAFIALSQGKLLNMLRSAALLSPIAHLGHIQSPLAKTASETFLAEDIYWLGVYQFAPRGEPAASLLEFICKQPGNNCSDLMIAFTGQNCCLDSNATYVYLQHGPQSTATKNMIHMAQMARTGAIDMYDYGNKNDNMNHYRQPTPPVYNMANISKDFPLYLSYGGRDLLSVVDDVKLLLGNLKNHRSDKLVVQYIENYAHADFILGSDAHQVVYDPIMAFFKRH